jgi:MFS family permease
MTVTTQSATRLGLRRTASVWRMLAVVLGGQAMASMDGSIVNVAMPSIKVQLPASGAQLQLISAGYLLAFAALVVTGARLGDRYGPARMFRVGLATFTAASLACGLAPDANALIASRLVQGTAGALMVAQVISLIQARFDGAARAKAFGLYSLVLALGVAAGQILGGVIVTADLIGLGWRPVLLVNVPLGVVLLVAATRLLPPDPAPALTRFDLRGVALLAGSVGAAVGPLTIGQERGWPAWSLVTLFAGLGGLAVFVWYERRVLAVSGQPLVDLRALRPPGVAVGLAACFLVMGCYAAFIFTFTLYLQGGLGFTPLRAGLTFVPFAAGFATTSLSWTRLPTRVQRWLPVFGPLAFAAGITLTVSVAAGRWPALPAFGLLAVAGAGHAASFSPLLARIAALIGARFGSALSGLANTGTLLAGAVSVAGLGGLYLSATAHHPTAAHLGLTRVVLAIDAVLLATAACALWTVTRDPRGSRLDG